MERGDFEETLTYGGQTLTYSQPSWRCSDCDEGLLEGADNEVHDAALHELMARTRNSPISPLLIKAAREAVGASQREAGTVFGGGPTAFYKYESGKAAPSAGMANLLRLAIVRPELFQKQKRGHFQWPRQEDVDLIRKADRDDRLSRIFGSVYPAAAPEPETGQAESG